MNNIGEEIRSTLWVALDKGMKENIENYIDYNITVNLLLACGDTDIALWASVIDHIDAYFKNWNK